MAIEIMDAGSVIASATLVIPRAAGEPCRAVAARGISAVSSPNVNTMLVTLDQPVDPENTQIHVSVNTIFGGTTPDRETTATVYGPNQIAVGLAANSIGSSVFLLVLAIRGPTIEGTNTIP